MTGLQQLVTTYAYPETEQQEQMKAMMLKNVALELDRQTFFVNFEKQNTNPAERIPATGGGDISIVGGFGTDFKINITNVANIIKSVKGSNQKRFFQIRFLEGHVARDFRFIAEANASATPPLNPIQRVITPEPVYIKLNISTNTTPYDFSIAPVYDKGQGTVVTVEELPTSLLTFRIGALDCAPGQSQGCISEMNQWIISSIDNSPDPDLETVVYGNQQATSVNFRLAINVLHAF